jgi:hypothetical protein
MRAALDDVRLAYMAEPNTAPQFVSGGRCARWDCFLAFFSTIPIAASSPLPFSALSMSFVCRCDASVRRRLRTPTQVLGGRLLFHWDRTDRNANFLFAVIRQKPSATAGRGDSRSSSVNFAQRLILDTGRNRHTIAIFV